MSRFTTLLQRLVGKDERAEILLAFLLVFAVLIILVVLSYWNPHGAFG